MCWKIIAIITENARNNTHKNIFSCLKQTSTNTDSKLQGRVKFLLVIESCKVSITTILIISVAIAQTFSFIKWYITTITDLMFLKFLQLYHVSQYMLFYKPVIPRSCLGKLSGALCNSSSSCLRNDQLDCCLLGLSSSSLPLLVGQAILPSPVTYFLSWKKTHVFGCPITMLCGTF
jgi:hypothetical protein